MTSRAGWRTGTDWLFRLFTEPRRLAGRYTVGNARFMWLVLKEAMRGRSHRA
jgi:N-acetylglucosaminyldiphosphoundecaprenol N-acetyl-beta-D-mannosaminyltransferase